MSHGLEVTAVEGLGLTGKTMREVSLEETIALVSGTDTMAAEANLIGCTDLHALEVV